MTPKEDRATDIGSRHKKLVKIGCVVPDICSQTDRYTHPTTPTRGQSKNASLYIVICRIVNFW